MWMASGCGCAWRHRLPRPIDLPLTDVPVLLGWLLDTLATGPDAFDSLHDS